MIRLISALALIVLCCPYSTTKAQTARAESLPISGRNFAAEGLQCNELMGANITAVAGNKMTLEGNQGTISNVSKSGESYNFVFTSKNGSVSDSIIVALNGDFTLKNKFGLSKYKYCK